MLKENVDSKIKRKRERGGGESKFVHPHLPALKSLCGYDAPELCASLNYYKGFCDLGMAHRAGMRLDLNTPGSKHVETRILVDRLPVITALFAHCPFQLL